MPSEQLDTMLIIKDFSKDEFVFDNLANLSSVKQINIKNETIDLNFQEIIYTQFTAGNIGHLFESLKAFLNLGKYSKAPCGGFVNFFEIMGTGGTKFVIYSGVNELSNSHYKVTIHKIIII